MPPEETDTPVEVTVEVTVPEPETVTPEVPAVVVVEAEPESTTEVVVETAIDHEGRIAVIESRLDAIEASALNAEATAEVALNIAASEPEEPVVDLTPEPVQEPVEPDIAPDNEHWFFKKKGWF